MGRREMTAPGIAAIGGVNLTGSEGPPLIDALSEHPQRLVLPGEVLRQLHLVHRYDDVAAAVREGNAVDYGLTAGVYARDRAELDFFLERAEAGVLYANRASGATTGAWPGIQSFCGWKGSGASGKGGLGPHYLTQFLREQSCTIMTG